MKARYLSANEVAEELGVSLTTAQNHMRCIGPGYRDNIPLRAFNSWLTHRSPGVVYFAFAPAAGLVKIGHADIISRRFKHLQAMSPLPLTLLGTVRGSLMKERHYHRRFRLQQSHGEWFWLKDDLLEYLSGQGALP